MARNYSEQGDEQNQFANKKSDYQKDRPDYESKEPQEEARAYYWSDLTPEQRDAGSQVLALIQGMVEAGDQRRDDTRNNPFGPILPPIREDHNSNVILIDGGRGSGKTSLMATILQDLKEDLEREHSSFKWSNPVIPVAFLDLHPLPKATHLLLHLVGQLEKVIKFLESLTSSSLNGLETAPWKSAERLDLACRQRWRELFEAVVTWESNLQQRAVNLDLDFYAWELGREESRRRGIGQSFREFVDALCLDVTRSSDLIIRRGRGQRTHRFEDDQPFFIIALDDADLVPERSVEILDLLRKLWHPRLLFLLTGDSNQFMSLLRNSCLGVLLQPLVGINIRREGEDLDNDTSEAVKLASSIYDKIISPRHRCKIEELSHQVKLSRLSKQLTKISLETNLSFGDSIQVPQNLYYYFEKEKYATAALPSHIRSFLNVANNLDVLIAKKQSSHKKIAQFVHDRWTSLLHSEPLVAEDRDILLPVVGVDEVGMLFVEGLPLVCQYTARRIREARLGELDSFPKGRLTVGRDHRLTIFRSRSRFPLSEPIKGALKLATDLVADIEEFYFVQDSPTPSGFNLAPVVVQWELVEGYRPFTGFAWALPDWHDFLSFTLFHQSWSSLSLEDLPPREPTERHLEILARWFLNILLTVAEERRESKREEITDPPSFEELSQRVVALAVSRETKRAQANSSWAYSRAGLLSAPESGLPNKVANDWLGCLKNAFGAEPRAWTQVKQRLIDDRRQQVRERWQGPEPDHEIVEEILAHISDASRGFLWEKEIERRKLSAPLSVSSAHPPRKAPGRGKRSPGAE